MLGQLGFWVARNFHGGELPHAGEEDVVVSPRIANEKRSALRIAQNCCGDAEFYGGTLFADGGNFGGEIFCSRLAPARYGAESAAGRLRRADYFAEFHQSLVPIAGSVEREKV